MYVRMYVYTLLPAVLIQLVLHPARHFSWSTLHLSKQSDNIQPWLYSFPNWNQSVVPGLVLTVAS